ncbi:MAG: FAD-dependent oxidoreductase, partial [Nocardioides sp.]
MPLSSLWQDQHDVPASGRIPAPTSEVAGDWDVVIVGAGITGLTQAVLLSAAGQKVLVLEARLVGSGTTGRSTAKVSLLQGTQLTQVARHHSAATVKDYVAANREAQAWLATFCAAEQVRLERRTAYTYATTDRGEKSVQREMQLAGKAGLDVSWVEEPQLPFETRGAVSLPDQLQVDPVALLLALRSRATAQGALVIEGAPVHRVNGHDPVSVVTSAGTARGRTVIVATNTPILDRGAHFARVEAARSYSLAFRTAAARVDGMYLSADAPSRSLRDAQDSDGGPLLMVGGNGHPTGRASSPRSRLDEIRAWTRKHFGELDEIAAWSAQDYVPHHALPYAGPLGPGRHDVLFAGGYSKWGMTNGVAAALVLAGRLADDEPAWSRAFGTWSARELTGLPTAARANAGVA